ncbi:MAG: endonuclease/exonuclease/phosphatase family metal-dependent hydrolase [Planctomycetota bacterium]|jgi:endonuclease/exonuclease/phosphatase family metal-dependent hydrolase
MKSMRLFLLFVFSTAFFPLASAQQAEVVAQGKLRVATWNLLNLFDNFDHPVKPDEGTPPKSVADLRAMAKVIDALDADVLGVQEVENRSVLEKLNVHLKKPFLHIELIEGNDFRGIDNGVMSRLPIEKSTSHRLRPLAADHRFSRDFPVFRIRISKTATFDLGVVHFKSKRGKKERSDAWRAAEANEVARIAKERQGDVGNLGLVVVGDFNDYKDSQPLAKLMAGFVDHTAVIPDKDRFTFIYRGKGEQIDFILSTPGMKSNRALIHRDTDFASDHFPVVVEFQVPEKVVRPVVPQGKPFEEPNRPNLEATDLVKAKTLLLQEVEIEGTVTKVYRPKSGQSISINFHQNYKQAITAYIPRQAMERMGDLDKLVGKKLRVRGPLSKHRNTFQIVVTRKEQLLTQ